MSLYLIKYLAKGEIKYWDEQVLRERDLKVIDKNIYKSLIKNYQGIVIKEYIMKIKHTKEVNKVIDILNVYFKLKNKKIDLYYNEFNDTFKLVVINSYNKFLFSITQDIYARGLTINEYRMIEDRIYSNENIDKVKLYDSVIIFENSEYANGMVRYLQNQYDLDCYVTNI